MEELERHKSEIESEIQQYQFDLVQLDRQRDHEYELVSFSILSINCLLFVLIY